MQAPLETAPCAIVGGRYISQLRVRDRGDTVDLILDNRFSLTVPKEAAIPTASMIANALAIGQGYSHAGAETKDQPFAPQVGYLGEMP